MAKGDGTKAANDNKGGLKVEHWHVDQLRPYDRNPRTHDDGQLDKLVASMREFGFTNPIMADDQGIVAGHGRWMAASRIYSEPGDIVLDLFGGSGSTLIACDQAGRSARLMELDPRFVDVIVKRWQDLTGRIARLEANGQSFEEVRAARAKEGKPADAA